MLQWGGSFTGALLLAALWMLVVQMLLDVSVGRERRRCTCKGERVGRTEAPYAGDFSNCRNRARAVRGKCPGARSGAL